jgi:hypothetical protein
LTRYAAQSLYAPLRTVESCPAYAGYRSLRTELPTLLPTENVSSTPIAAWRLGDYWVTAVKLRNRGSETVQSIRAGFRPSCSPRPSACFPRARRQC